MCWVVSALSGSQRGDTGDDAEQERVLAGSALLYNPLTNWVTHWCFGPGREQTHCLGLFKHETKEGQTKSRKGKSQTGTSKLEQLALSTLYQHTHAYAYVYKHGHHKPHKHILESSTALNASYNASYKDKGFVFNSILYGQSSLSLQLRNSMHLHCLAKISHYLYFNEQMGKSLPLDNWIFFPSLMAQAYSKMTMPGFNGLRLWKSG